jgi:hypothetical protein
LICKEIVADSFFQGTSRYRRPTVRGGLPYRWITASRRKAYVYYCERFSKKLDPKPLGMLSFSLKVYLMTKFVK